MPGLMTALEMPKLLADPARRASLEARSLLALAQAGVIGVDSPRRILQVIGAINSYGAFGAAPKIAAIRHGSCVAIADERGEISYDDFDRHIDQLANALRDRVALGGTVGILCRNHRGPLLAAFASSRAGLNVVWLNTAFGKRQAAEVAEREGVDLLVHDAEFDDLVAAINPRLGRVTCDIQAPADELDALVAAGSASAPPAPAKAGRIILLTSGTTGTPKGAPRTEPRGFSLPGSILDRMPMRPRGATVIGPPLFHGTGLMLALLSVSLGSKVVLRRTFDAEQLLDDIATHRATTVCVVPIMLQRVLALGDDAIRRRDTSSLQVAFCAGSQLPASIATKTLEVFGDVLYNLYGSTEVSVATIATPQDVRVAPTSVGKPALGSRVRILDDRGNEVPTGITGRIFVGTATPFEGYTGGGNKEVIAGLMSSGDVGHFDHQGRLYIDGRDDDMIVSGGENVFPAEVEELLIAHTEILDAAAIGVDDDEFGKRLRAFVVAKPGATVTEDHIKAYVKENLARYKVPRDVVFIDELPRNPTGKVLKRQLATWSAT
ncbi:MAG: AMP-binding protein [Marmoricola sp.]